MFRSQTKAQVTTPGCSNTGKGASSAVTEQKWSDCISSRTLKHTFAYPLDWWETSSEHYQTRACWCTWLYLTDIPWPRGTVSIFFQLSPTSVHCNKDSNLLFIIPIWCLARQSTSWKENGLSSKSEITLLSVIQVRRCKICDGNQPSPPQPWLGAQKAHCWSRRQCENVKLLWTKR